MTCSSMRTVLAAILVFVGALGGAARIASADSTAAAALAKMTEFKDQMCGCRDTACGQRVLDAMTKWSQDQARASATPPKMTNDETKRASTIGEELGRCMQHAMGNAAAVPPPSEDDIVAQQAAFKDEMCTCKGPSCALGVSLEITDWQQTNVPDSMSDSATGKVVDLGLATNKCMQRALAAASTAGDMLDTLTKFRQRMCACSDGECSRHVFDALTTWSQNVAKLNKPMPKMTDADNKKANSIGEEIGRCMKRATPAGSTASSGTSAREAIAKMASFKDEMCSCTDTACAQRVSDDMARWSQEQAQQHGPAASMSPEETQQTTQLGEAMGKCMQRAMGAR